MKVAISGLMAAALAILPMQAYADDKPCDPNDAASLQTCEGSIAVFGTTVVIPSGFRGEIFRISDKTKKLPNFQKLKPIGSIYTNSFNITPRDFMSGFPGVPDLVEWFAIQYEGKFWVQNPGTYKFVLTSDDGSRLLIDDKKIIDNDGAHVATAAAGEVRLEGGLHFLQLQYFQGPRFHVALVLEVAGTGENLRVFSVEEFKPPPNPEDWKFAVPATGLIR